MHITRPLRAIQSRMTRWFAFDEEGADTAASLTGGTAFFQRGDALTSAISTPGNSVMIAPSVLNSCCVLLKIRHARRKQERLSYQPSGFLGINDSLVLEEETTDAEQRRWWKRDPR